MNKPRVVLKFGGTSVAGRPQWEAILQQLQSRNSQGFGVVLVCSAVTGVTNKLTALLKGEGSVTEVVERHRELCTALGIDGESVLQIGRDRLDNALAKPNGPRRDAAVLACGEWFSTRIGHQFLSQQLDVQWVDARSLLQALPESSVDNKRAWLSARCASVVDADPAELAAGSDVLITQGFVVRGPEGEAALLGRGGSDTSASLLASRFKARFVEIWTDVAGLYTADPRTQADARLIPSLTYSEALEMAAGGARVIHGQAIRVAGDAGVPLYIRKAGTPEAGGTLISSENEVGNDQVRAVVCQPNMLVLLLENLDTRQEVGFLAGVFAVFSRHGVSVDLVATSETTTTLAINRSANHLESAELEQIVNGLSELCAVDVFEDCSCVNLVGRDVRKSIAMMGPVADFFDHSSLLMMSQSANDLSISFLVHGEDARPLVSLLHRVHISSLES